MGYKTKSTLKQSSMSGLSVDYYLNEELKKLSASNLEPKIKQGLGLKKTQLEKDFSLNHSDRKEVRRAGREAANETEFTKATPMGGDYFSLMAATAENIASRASTKGKEKKQAKLVKRDKIKRAKQYGEPMEKMESKSAPKTKLIESLKSDIDKSKGLSRTPTGRTIVSEKPNEVESSAYTIDNQESWRKLTQPLYEEKQLTKSQQQFQQLNPIGKKKQKPRGYSDNSDKSPGQIMAEKQRALNTLYTEGGTKKLSAEQRAEIIKVGTDYDIEKRKKDKESYEQSKESYEQSKVNKSLTTQDFDSKLKKSSQERVNKINADRQRAIEEARTKLNSLPMLGDGFSKGISRKNKYKK